MKPRDRVLAALAHEETDRPPIDLGASLVTSITKSAYLPLSRHLGLSGGDPVIFDNVQQLPYLPESLLERFGVDVRPVCVPAEKAAPFVMTDEADYWGWDDEWGAHLRMPKHGGLYFDWVTHPLDDITDDEIDRLKWPPFESDATLAAMRDQAIALRRDTDYALFGPTTNWPIYERVCHLVGMEKFMMAMLTERKAVERLLEMVTDHLIEDASRQLDAIGDYLDVVQVGDDVSTQTGWQISPELYAQLIKPQQRRLFDVIKSKTKARLFYHACGAVFDYIPHLIDVGVDILNPVQVNAKGMDSVRLKATYGQDMTFWGGGVDTQHVLPFGTPDDVRAEVRLRLHDFAPGGGFVWAAVHNIQGGVPPENIVAAFDTVLESTR